MSTVYKKAAKAVIQGGSIFNMGCCGNLKVKKASKKQIDRFVTLFQPSYREYCEMDTTPYIGWENLIQKINLSVLSLFSSCTKCINNQRRHMTCIITKQQKYKNKQRKASALERKKKELFLIKQGKALQHKAYMEEIVASGKGFTPSPAIKPLPTSPGKGYEPKVGYEYTLYPKTEE